MITFEQWTDYKKKSGDDFDFLPADCIVGNDKGFVKYNITEDSLFIQSMYGDGEYWMSYMEKRAKELGKKKLQGFTKRNPKAWNRRFKTHVYGYFIEKEVE